MVVSPRQIVRTRTSSIGCFSTGKLKQVVRRSGKNLEGEKAGTRCGSSFVFSRLPSLRILPPFPGFLASCLTEIFLLFFFLSSGFHRDLHSFPTRRSSD